MVKFITNKSLKWMAHLRKPINQRQNYLNFYYEERKRSDFGVNEQIISLTENIMACETVSLIYLS